jgi:hypothetical protein
LEYILNHPSGLIIRDRGLSNKQGNSNFCYVYCM